MRQMLSKAKRKEDGKWIVGYYQQRFNVFEEAEHLIFTAKSSRVWEYAEIVPETLCRITGKKDADENEIFEGDILQQGNKTYTVEWSDDECCMMIRSNASGYLTEISFIGKTGYNNMKIIGNKYN